MSWYPDKALNRVYAHGAIELTAASLLATGWLLRASYRSTF